MLFFFFKSSLNKKFFIYYLDNLAPIGYRGYRPNRPDPVSSGSRFSVKQNLNFLKFKKVDKKIYKKN